MTTLRYECKKLFQNRAFLVLFALLLSANTVLAYITAPNTRELNDALAVCFDDYKSYSKRFDDVYQTYCIAKENAETQQLQAAMNGEDPTPYMFPEPTILYPEKGYSDVVYYRELYADKNTERGLMLQELLQQTAANLKVVSDPYMQAYLQQVQVVYSDQTRLMFQKELTAGWNDFFGYRGTALWLLFLIFAVSVLLASNDQVGDYERILFATKYGAKRILLCKLTVLFLVCVLSSVLFELSTLVIYASKSGLYGANAFLAALDSFLLCPYPIYIYEFVLLRMTFRIIALFAAGLFCLLIARLCRNLFVSFASCFCFMGLQVVLAVQQTVETGSFWKSVHLFSMLDVSSVCKKYVSVNIAGRSVPLLSVLIFVWICICCFLILLLLAVWKKQSIFPSCRKKRSRTRLPVWYSQTAFEFKKQFCKPLVILVVSLILILKGIQAFPQDSIPYREKLYQNYMRVVQNMTLSEAEQYLSDEQTYFEELFAKKEHALAAYQSGKIGFAEYSAVSMESHSAQTKYEVFLLVMADTERILALRQNGINARLVYPTGWNKLLCTGTDILPLILLLLPSFAYASEEKTGCRRLLYACPNGRRAMFLRKLAINLAVTVLLLLLMTVIELAGIAWRYTLPCTDTPLSSLSSFEHFGNTLSLGDAFLLTVSIRIFVSAVLSCFATALAALSGRTFLPTILYGGLLFLPYSVSIWQNDITRYFSAAELFCFKTLADFRMLPFAVVLIAATLIVCFGACRKA